jgi:hypothetical protein
MISAPFRFDKARHEYTTPAGVLIPNISALIRLAGLADDEWYTEEGKERGHAVHQLAAEFDLGALAVEECVSEYRPYLLAHARCVEILRPTFLHVETPAVHQTLGFAGTPDRVHEWNGFRGVWEIKTGAATKAYPNQTALQAILVADELRLPAEMVHRVCCYLQPDGRYKVEEHANRADVARARGIIREFCGATLEGRQMET